MGKCLAATVTFVLLLSLVMLSLPVKAQTTDNIVINPDGSVTGWYVDQIGTTYTLLANITGNIQVEKSNIVINGSGYTLDGNGLGGIDLTNDVQHEYNNPTISNVTIENLHLANGGVLTNGGANDTFYNDFFTRSGQMGFAIQLIGCSYNNISYCSFDNQSQIGMDYSANLNTVTECNLPPYGVLVWLSGGETIDKNYWSDYTTKYPNATEVDNSGIGNTPYVIYTVNDVVQTIVYQDNHPLMNPVTIPLIGSNTQTSIPEFPSLLVVIPTMLLTLFAAVIVRRRKIAHLKKATN